MLCEMGFDETLGRAALKRSNNDVATAIDLLMNGAVDGEMQDDDYSDMPPLAPVEDDDGPYATGGTVGTYPAGGIMVGGDFSNRADGPSGVRWKCKMCGQMNPIIVESCGSCNAPHL